MGARFPFTSFPDGWFQVAYADALPAGAAVPARCCGRELVLFRAADGQARAFDAYCPHLGAHLGHGGTVVAGALRCPFHGWCFDGAGRCVDAGGATKIPARAALDPWPVAEVNGLILVYHRRAREAAEARADAAPAWRVPPLSELAPDADGWEVAARRRWRIRTHVQEIAENLVDAGHFRTVHGTLSIPETTVESDGPLLRSVSRVEHPTPRGRVEGRFDIDGYGLGVWAVRFTGIVELRFLTALTPIDDELVEANLTFATRRAAPGEGNVARALIAEVCRQVDEDIPIWEHKIYRTTPALTAGDGPIAALRKWSRQFLVDADASPQ